MGQAINLLKNYPRTQRNIQERASFKTEADREIARRFGKEFFDGERRTGYGGFSYNPRFWQPVVPTFIQHYGLTQRSALLDIGCAKGFMLHDFKEALPGMTVRGIDCSHYAIEQALESMKPYVSIGDARLLPFEDQSFDLVISINTLHNLEGEELKQALREMQRVSRGKSFLTVDAYRTEEERELMFAWNLTAKTILHVEEWEALFASVGYTGDYYWFMP